MAAPCLTEPSMTANIRTLATAKKDARGGHWALKVQAGAYTSPSNHVKLWRDAAQTICDQLKAMGCSLPGCLQRLESWFSLPTMVGGTSRAFYGYLLLCGERKVIDIQFREGEGFYGIVEFVINDPAAFDSGPDAHYVVHTIAWARIPGRSVKLKTITKHWSDIGMEETVCAQSRKLVYTFNKAKLEKHERMNEVGRTKTLLIREAAVVTAVPVGGEGGGSTPHGLPRITTADGVVAAAAQPVTPGLFSKALARQPAPPPPAALPSLSSVLGLAGHPPPPPDHLHFYGVHSPLDVLAVVARREGGHSSVDFVNYAPQSSLDVLASVATHAFVRPCPSKKQRR